MTSPAPLTPAAAPGPPRGEEDEAETLRSDER